MSGRVIVTGAAGFIGSHLTSALLQDGWDVVGIDNFDPFYDRGLKMANVARLQRPGFQLIEADIRDRQRMNDTFVAVRPAIVFHLAGMPGVRLSIADPARYVDVNVNGTASILDAARAGACRNVVFASSSSVYGNNPKVPFAETDAVDTPISAYAATKRSAELIAHTYAHLFGQSIACLRFFTVYGPAQRPDLAIGSFLRLMAAGEEIPMFGDGSTSRDYTFIDDIIAGVRAAAARVEDAADGFFRIWNLGGSHPVKLAELIARIGEVVGRTPRVRRLPMQPGDVERTYADLTRSRAELGYEPRTALAEGLARQWDWLRRSQDDRLPTVEVAPSAAELSRRA